MPWKRVELMEQRKEFVLRAMKTDNFRRLCEEYEISTKTGYKWRERFLAFGWEGLRDESRRPQHSPRELGERVICEIIRIKQAHKSWGARKVRNIYQRLHGQAVPSESSVKRVLERAGMVERRRLRRRSKAGRLYSGQQAKAPNEVWTVDFKGWWYDRQQKRCEPLTVRDEYSRYVLELRALANARTETVQVCFERLFEEHGLPGAIRSDNGSPFASRAGVLGLSRLSAWWVVLGIDLERGRPGCPQDNGAHERLHWDISREVEGQDWAEQQAALDGWRQTFNNERPHEMLGMQFPAEVYRKSERKYEGTPADLSYEGMASRRVQEHGCFGWQGQKVFVSTSLAGWSVGLEPSEAKGKWKVWFGRLLLGELDEQTWTFQQSRPNRDNGNEPTQ
jgi:putative transposase